MTRIKSNILCNLLFYSLIEFLQHCYHTQKRTCVDLSGFFIEFYLLVYLICTRKKLSWLLKFCREVETKCKFWYFHGVVNFLGDCISIQIKESAIFVMDGVEFRGQFRKNSSVNHVEIDLLMKLKSFEELKWKTLKLLYL